MKTYKVKMTSNRVFDIRAGSAADAIQDALLKNPGDTVKSCIWGEPGAGISYEVPPHKALTVIDVERLLPAKREKKGRRDITVNKPAPWMQGFLEKHRH